MSYSRASLGKFIVSIVLERRLVVNLYRISMQENHISMQERILPRQFEY